jgi:hypothetical protein
MVHTGVVGYLKKPGPDIADAPSGATGRIDFH